ncbi:transcriptional regulator GcvA [Rhodospirillum rubrum]|uniref:Transcriptional regulator, LysR family n=1 Tax=Rhodospirillum rubrum (strain ATCC 11170 / ATH 1.1.1 / DSM 467 / LMG 4362 / NCIMB 8255 / S1) TaxID=269796 RepID=Q2RS80_RHORT|nr:transcriptional regulator GcvA [Rhodospirillum rubrum]ABC23015.1 transcriptional regulator, LysR family [Rhodospirillum rubrum ATCC 11170]AEO48744.1 LysR family transcriptional regulator [Rhodospirillum rubrum F11]MBK5954638.1 LysR family transcriptional regulator [Rhodospirillum rubrum]QXG78999.1 transcriptional regulator GcvA [Rhodospirillum rubrum]HCF17325.1 transcriptional regulator GcvA [Rhodospirillum rubrum]
MVRRLPPLNALRAFEAAARHGGFTGAARELHVTPAAVSHQVKGLEDALGVSLFHRLAKGLELTAAGRAYLPELTAGFDQLARASERLKRGALVGRLTVSVLPSFAAGWLAPRLASFLRRYPDILLDLRSTPRTVDFIRERVDLGIRYGGGIYPGLASYRILEEEVFPICAPALLNGPVPLRGFADLRHHVLLHDPGILPGEPWTGWEPWLAEAGVTDIDLEAGHGFTESIAMIHACVAGLGVGIGRSGLVTELLRSGRLVRPFPVSRPADFSYWVVVPPPSQTNPKAAAFIGWLLETAGRGGAGAGAQPDLLGEDPS